MTLTVGSTGTVSGQLGALASSVARIAGEIAGVAPRELDSRLAEWLGDLGQACGADRVSLCRAAPGGRSIGVVHEWSEAGLPSATLTLTSRPA